MTASVADESPTPPTTEATDAHIGTQRIIKKYPNRRLYDTTASAYITLAEVKQLVMQCAPFCVRDAKTGEDLTRSILLQIILEEEASGTPLLSVAVLSGIIRFYGHAMQDMLVNNLENTMQMFATMQQKMMQIPTPMHPQQAWQQMMQAPVQNMQNTVQGMQQVQETVQEQVHQLQHMQEQIQRQYMEQWQKWLQALQPRS